MLQILNSAEYETALLNFHHRMQKCAAYYLLSALLIESTDYRRYAIVSTVAVDLVMAASNFFKVTGGLIAAGAAVFGGQVCQITDNII